MSKIQGKLFCFVLMLCLCVGAIAVFAANNVQAAPVQLEVGVKLDKTTVKPGEDVTATVYLINYKEITAEIGSVFIEVPVQTNELTYVANSRKTDVKDAEFSSNETIIGFTYLPMGAGDNALPKDTVDLFSFKMTAKDTLTGDVNAKLPATISVGDLDDEPLIDTTKDYIISISDKVAVTGVSLNKTTADIVVGESITLNESITPSDATNKKVTWSSDADSVATVKSGVVSAVSEGTATITVTTEDGSKTATCKVTVSKAPVKVDSVRLNKTETALTIGATETLSATVLPEDATNKKVSWSSDAESIATVKDGVVTAVAEGTATITATTEDGSKTATCKVTVSKPIVNVESVNLNKTETALVIGGTETLTATVLPADATNKKVSWSSDAEAIATVADGVVTAVAEGSANITVTTEDGSKTATCKVTISKAPVSVESVSLSKTATALTIGGTETLTATVLPADATNQKINWGSDKEAVATVKDGVVTAVAEGTATITVTTEDGNKTATCVVTVSKPVVAVESVSVNKTEAAMTIGETETLTATVLPEDATNKKVSWSSDTEAVATVKDGVVTAVAEGTATISVTTEDGNKTAACVITVTKPIVKVESVTLDKAAVALNPGQSETVNATVKPADAANQNIAWSSDKEEIATVKDGVITAVAEGEATITVTTEDGKKTATCKVTVTKAIVHVESITLDKTTADLLVGEKATVTATVKPDDATNKSVTWTSDQEGIATVVDGVITAVTPGEATITATTADGGKTATCTVNVTKVDVESITLDKTEAPINIGEPITLTATIKPENATYKNVEWSSDNESVATVKDGIVTPIGEGEAIITATALDSPEALATANSRAAGKIIATCKIIVSRVDVEGISLDQTELALTTGKTGVLTASLKPSNATNKNVLWSSDNEKVATVKDGVVTAVAKGEATITVTTEEGGKTATCKVTVTDAPAVPTTTPTTTVTPGSGTTTDKNTTTANAKTGVEQNQSTMIGLVVLGLAIVGIAGTFAYRRKMTK